MKVRDCALVLVPLLFMGAATPSKGEESIPPPRPVTTSGELDSLVKSDEMLKEKVITEFRQVILNRSTEIRARAAKENNDADVALLECAEETLLRLGIKLEDAVEITIEPVSVPSRKLVGKKTRIVIPEGWVRNEKQFEKVPLEIYLGFLEARWRQAGRSVNESLALRVRGYIQSICDSEVPLPREERPFRTGSDGAGLNNGSQPKVIPLEAAGGSPSVSAASPQESKESPPNVPSQPREQHPVVTKDTRSLDSWLIVAGIILVLALLTAARRKSRSPESGGFDAR